jgi:hypothetical protein
MSIGPAFGLKNFVAFAHNGAKFRQHILQDVVGLYQQSPRFNLTGRMTVTDMPCQPHKIGPCDLQHILFCRKNPYKPPVVQNKRVARSQRRCVFQIDKKPFAARHGQHFPA